MTIYTISQSLTLSNFFHKTPGKFKFSHNIGRVELYQKKNSQPSSICPSHPWVAHKNLTIHSITQSLTLSNFFHKTHGKFKFGHNIGKFEIYENIFSTPSPSVPCTRVALENSTIHSVSQSLTLSNFFHQIPGQFKFGHNIGRIELYQNKFTTQFSSAPPAPG